MTADASRPQAANRLRQRSWKLAKKAARIVIGVYLGLALILSLMQEQLIFPGAATQGRRDAIVEPRDGAEVVKLKAKTGENIAALFGPALTSDGQPHPDAKHRPTLLYFYGNGMCMADCVDELTLFRRRGFNIMVPDFIGYGMSGGKPSEAGVYATADACFDHLLQRSDLDRRKIVPAGWSLGATAAIHLASTRDVPCVVTVSAFTSMSDMAKRFFPLVPASMILKHHFENEKKLAQVRVPIFIAHGTRDSTIPFAMSRKLAAAAGGPVTRYDVEDGDHNDVFDVGGPGMLDAMAQFIDKHT